MENFVKAPYEFIQSEESKLIIYNFASLCSLLHGKKLTMQAIFTLLLTDNLYREVLYDMLSTRNDLDIFLVGQFHHFTIPASLLCNLFIRTDRRS